MKSYKNTMFGSRNIVTADPRHIGEIINDYLRSDSPLAKGYRQFLASSEIVAEKGDKE